MNNSKNPVARQSGLVVQEMPDEVLVYDMQSNKAHCLNGSAAFVWRSCDGTRSVADIVREFESTGGGKVTEDFVWLAIDQLNENNLLDAGMAPRFAGQSRRQVLKTIGLASMVAIPLISSLVAPQNALANLSCSCVGNGDCTTRVGCQSQQNCNGQGICAPNTAPRT
ncbi:MAG: PqqD family protein [Pyrinomonadaceae bacterium]|nr:PqqD family protein [Pyrinomonadaceae bacterium]